MTHRFLAADGTTLSAFKLMLKHRGIDPGRIPDAALVDIVVVETERARRRSAVDDGATSQLPPDWQRPVLPLLDAEADLVEKVMRDGPEKYTDHHTTQILLKYGAVEPPCLPAMSAEEFSEAARLGTLYSELDDRISRREFS